MRLPVAVLDANVLFPLMLRDVFVSLAALDVFDARWTNQIHDEWIRNVLKSNPGAARETLENTRRLMDLHVPNALVEGFEPLIETLSLPDPNDRHVLAAAIQAHAPTIVTWNLKDFPAPILTAHDIRAVSPDVFAVELLEQSSNEVIRALAAQRRRLKNPPQTPTQFLETLSRQKLKRFVASLEPFKDQL